MNIVHGLMTKTKEASISILWIESTIESDRQKQKQTTDKMQRQKQKSRFPDTIKSKTNERDDILFPFLYQSCLEIASAITSPETASRRLSKINWHLDHNKVPVTEWFDWTDVLPQYCSSIPEIRNIILQYADTIAFKQWIDVCFPNCHLPQHNRHTIYEFAAEESRPLISHPIHLFSDGPQIWSEEWPDHKTPFLSLTIHHTNQLKDMIERLAVERRHFPRKLKKKKARANIIKERDLLVLDHVEDVRVTDGRSIGQHYFHQMNLNVCALWIEDIISSMKKTCIRMRGYICMTFEAADELLHYSRANQWIEFLTWMTPVECKRQLRTLLKQSKSNAQQGCFILCPGPGHIWKLWSP
jgi:hypothetical protein